VCVLARRAWRGRYPGVAGPVRWWAGIGNGGQRLHVMPDLDLVVAIVAGSYDTSDQSTTPSTIVDELILAAVRSETRDTPGDGTTAADGVTIGGDDRDTS
jgi:hypothetical protein